MQLNCGAAAVLDAGAATSPDPVELVGAVEEGGTMTPWPSPVELHAGPVEEEEEESRDPIMGTSSAAASELDVKRVGSWLHRMPNTTSSSATVTARQTAPRCFAV